jgi:hypothetical protein
MLQCWKDERRERPSFEKIAAVIETWIISPETMNDETIPLSPIGMVCVGAFALITACVFNSSFNSYEDVF